MPAELIGAGRCPLCASDKARVSLSKAGLPVLTCNACNMQLFARSSRSDDLVRRLLIARPSPAPVLQAAPVLEAAPVIEAAPVPPPTAPARKPAAGSIFDTLFSGA